MTYHTTYHTMTYPRTPGGYKEAMVMKAALWFWEDDREFFPTWWAVDPDDGGLVVMWGDTYEYDPAERQSQLADNQLKR